MASILKRGSRYRVLIRKKGFPVICKSFSSRSSAETFAKETESQIERGAFRDHSPAEMTSLSELIERYREQILPSMKSKDTAALRLNLLERELGNYTLITLTPLIVSRFKDRRLKVVKPATIRRDLGALSSLLTAAEKEFGIYLPNGNPVRKIRVPREPPGRDRRLEDCELDQLMEALEGNHLIQQIVRFAIATGMRRGEICKIRKQDINWDKKTLHIPVTKNGIPRTIPLSTMASESLLELLKLSDGIGMESPVISLKDPHSVTRAFSRACKRAEIEDLRFHDLRHEATSRFFERGLNVMEVASITGHQDLRMLRRYTHIRAETLVDRL